MREDYYTPEEFSPRHYRRFTKEEDDFICEHQSQMTNYQLAKLLDRSSKSVKYRINALGLRKNAIYKEVTKRINYTRQYKTKEPHYETEEEIEKSLSLEYKPEDLTGEERFMYYGKEKDSTTVD